MEVVAWILAVGFAALAAFLGLRGAKPNPYPEALRRLTDEVEAGEVSTEAGPADPPEAARLRRVLDRTLRAERKGKEGEVGRDPGEEAVRGLFRYLRRAVLQPLEAALRNGSSGGTAALEDAVDALRDLDFYAAEVAGEPSREENLSDLVQSVTREYTRETGVPVKFVGPPHPVKVEVGPEGFKDALFLLLANAGRFGDGETVEVRVEADADRIRLSVRDSGVGFSREALEHGFEPFWTSDPDALGLGLTYARRLFEARGAALRVGNRDDGGAEAEVRFPAPS